MSSFPFKVSESGFTYLGTNITPMIYQLSKVNFIPLLDKICSDLIRWWDLPLSWLGRIAVVKMNLMPRLLYPLQMIPILLPNKRIKEFNGWFSSFTWKNWKLRLTFSKLQLSGASGGFELPDVRKYQLACQLRFIAKWLLKRTLHLFGLIERLHSHLALYKIYYLLEVLR